MDREKKVAMKKEKWLKQKRRRELAELIKQQKREMFFDTSRSLYGVNRRLKKI